MAKSSAKKAREKQIRAGRLDPRTGRSLFAGLDLHTRMTKTKKDLLFSTKHKNRTPENGGEGSFFMDKYGLTLL